MAERGRDPDGVRLQWETTVAPMHDEFVQPCATGADEVVAYGSDRGAVLDSLCSRLEAHTTAA